MLVEMTIVFDTIGYWSEVKLDIIEHYALEYSKILVKQKNPELNHIYIDAFAGSGTNISRTTGEYVRGSAQRALNIKPPFKEYYFIDTDGDKVVELNKLVSNRPEAHVFQNDCNSVLLNEILPKVCYKDYRRGLCLLDPYGLNLKWNVIEKAGQMGSIDMMLNFPVMAMNRNVLWSNPEGVDPADILRMNDFWGDSSWNQVAYIRTPNLFGEIKEFKQNNETIASSFRKRLIDVAKFKYVPKPIPMRNSMGSTIYYLFFASQNKAANTIATYLFDAYRNRGIV